jgi:hypothetical protein
LSSTTLRVIENNMTNPAFIADLERLEDEIDEALLHGPNDDSQRRI